jgi:hypothetical protein
MIESPSIQEIIDQTMQKMAHRYILRVLEARFGQLPAEVSEEVNAVSEEDQLQDLLDFAVLCPDLASFRARLIR